MKNLLWASALLVAFAAGYFTKSITQQDTINSLDQTVPTIASNNDKNISNEDLKAATKAAFSEKEEHSNLEKPIVENLPTEQQPVAPSSPQSDSVANTETPVTPENKYPNEISDEDIDKIIPAPFNQSLKNRHGPLREKYKLFAEATQQSDWDIHNQNLLSDAISSNPYAKFIEIESLQCKVNFCEIRLFENKEGTWSLIMADMRVQDWWDIGGSSSSGRPTDTPSKLAWHVLLPRR